MNITTPVLVPPSQDTRAPVPPTRAGGQKKQEGGPGLSPWPVVFPTVSRLSDSQLRSAKFQLACLHTKLSCELLCPSFLRRLAGGFIPVHRQRPHPLSVLPQVFRFRREGERGLTLCNGEYLGKGTHSFLPFLSPTSKRALEHGRTVPSPGDSRGAPRRQNGTSADLGSGLHRQLSDCALQL